MKIIVPDDSITCESEYNFGFINLSKIKVDHCKDEQEILFNAINVFKVVDVLDLASVI